MILSAIAKYDARHGRLTNAEQHVSMGTGTSFLVKDSTMFICNHA